MEDIKDKKIQNPETGHDIKIGSALQYSHDSEAYQKAKNIIQKMGDNNQEKKEKIKNPYIEKYGKLKLNAYPTADVKPENIKEDLTGDIHSHAILVWKNPVNGFPVRAYTQEFMKRNAKIKWKRVKGMKDENIKNIQEKSLKLLNKKDKLISDSAAIIAIIALTGLRPGNKITFQGTKNRGVSTLGSDNIQIDGDTIKLNFIGKSFQENNAEIKNQELASYLQKRINERKNEDFLFEVERNDYEKIFHKIAGNKWKIKDLRTYTATKMAKDILFNQKITLPDKPSKIKKLIKDILKNVYEQVSKKLNNTPAMAKSSYVHPEIISQWLEKIGVVPKEIGLKIEKLSLKKIYLNQKDLFENAIDSLEKKMNPTDLENCDQYPLPDWWDNDDIELVKNKGKIEETFVKKIKIHDKDISHIISYQMIFSKNHITFLIADSKDLGLVDKSILEKSLEKFLKSKLHNLKIRLDNSYEGAGIRFELEFDDFIKYMIS